MGKVIENKLYKFWNINDYKGDTVWHLIVQSKKRDVFWKKVFDNNLCDSWNIQNNTGNTVWHYVAQNKKSDFFLERSI